MPEQDPEVKEVSIDTLPMSEFMKARSEGKTAVPAESEPPKEEAQEQDKPDAPAKADAKPEADSGTDSSSGKSKGKGGFQTRIDKLTREKREALERAERAEAEAAKYRPGQAQPVKQVDPNAAPKREQFNSDDEFDDARFQWRYQQQRTREKQAEAERVQQETTRGIYETYTHRLDEARAKHEDFDGVIQSSGVSIPQVASNAIYEAPNGPDVMLHLAQNPEDAQKLFELTPIRQVAAIEWISQQLMPGSAPKPAKDKPKSQAPEPITPVGNANTKSSTPLDQMGMTEFMKARAGGRSR